MINQTLIIYFLTVIGFILIHISIVIRFYTFGTFLESILPQIFAQISIQAVLFDMWVAVLAGVVMIYMGILIMKTLNRKMENIFTKKKQNNIKIHKSIKQFIEEHNDFCQLYNDYNKFWSKLYLAFVLTIIPLNLLWLHQFLFESLDTMNKIVIGLSSIMMCFVIVIVQFFIALLSSRIHKSTKLLARLQWRLNGWPFRLQTKLRLMTYFERLSSSRKVGLSIGPIIVLTYPVFYQVILLILDFKIMFIIIPDDGQKYSVLHSGS